MQFDDLDPQVVDGILAKIAAAENEATLEVIRVSELGRSGRITTIARMIGGIRNEEQRRHHGEIINQAKDRVTAAIAVRKNQLKELRIASEVGSTPGEADVGIQSSVTTSFGKHVSAQIELRSNVAATANVVRAGIDVTLPVREAPFEIGRVHPITQVVDELTAIFADMGFAVAEGPDIETEDYNFTKLNFPEDHPAREMHDTFFFNPKPDGSRLLLRTHTSPVQIRTMLSQKPPIRVIIPGRTYRCDSDQTHTPMFHQVEGLVIDKGSHLGHLKWILQEFCKAFFEVDRVGMRFRPSFFPFTEPSLEVDIQCRRDKGEIRFGEGDDWLEILGCGMVHPNVLRNCGLDPDEYQGFAWGMGIDRIAMLKYGMPDLRAFFEADVRWLSHYGFRPLDLPTLAGGLS
jgi:phenylalanyl-tRNA synthetase alpha chain